MLADEYFFFAYEVFLQAVWIKFWKLNYVLNTITAEKLGVNSYLACHCFLSQDHQARGAALVELGVERVNSTLEGLKIFSFYEHSKAGGWDEGGP